MDGLTCAGYETGLAKRRTKEEILDAVSKSGGFLANVAKILDCRPSEFQLLSQRDGEIGRAWQAARADAVAQAEDCMRGLLSSEDENVRFKASKFVLERLGGREWGAGVGQGVRVT